jgi:REP element-mobilizing transposase RayT
LTLLSDYLKQDNDLYKRVAFVIMPNHVHLLLKPLQDLAGMIPSPLKLTITSGSPIGITITV